MGPKKSADGTVSKRKTLTIELKKAIIETYENGLKQKDIAAKYGLHKSTVQTILSNKEKIKNAKVSKGVSKIHAESQRKNCIDQMEKLLLLWIRERQMMGDSVRQGIIREKARLIYENLKGKEQEEGCTDVGKEPEKEFKASRGWFNRFCKRSGIHSVAVFEETGGIDKGAAEKFLLELHYLIKTEGYLKQHLFNVYEISLYWKRMPSRTYIAQDERTSGVRSMKDRLTLLLGANCSGDFKLKPLLVYNFENPWPFNKKGIIRSNLPVMWRANSRACITQVFFKEWIFTVFVPSVQAYLEQNGLPLKALLILDDSLGHSKDIEELLQESFPWLKILYMPPNTTSILQPMDQLVIENFKKLYTLGTFRHCLGRCSFSISELSIKQFWKEEYDIVEAIRLILWAWEQVTENTLNSAWRTLTPNFVFLKPNSDDDIVQEIIYLAHELKMDLNELDIQELIQDDAEQLSLGELQQPNEYMQETEGEYSSNEEERDVKPSLLELQLANKSMGETQEEFSSDSEERNIKYPLVELQLPRENMVDTQGKIFSSGEESETKLPMIEVQLSTQNTSERREEISSDDEERDVKPSWEELQQANRNMLQMEEEISSEDEGEEVKKFPVPSSVIKELLEKWEDVRRIVTEWHPNQCEVNQVGDLFDIKAIQYFRDLKRWKQSAMGSYYNPNFYKRPRTEDTSSTSQTGHFLKLKGQSKSRKTEKCTEYL